jgi:hypothetical protein
MDFYWVWVLLVRIVNCLLFGDFGVVVVVEGDGVGGDGVCCRWWMGEIVFHVGCFWDVSVMYWEIGVSYLFVIFSVVHFYLFNHSSIFDTLLFSYPSP